MVRSNHSVACTRRFCFYPDLTMLQDSVSVDCSFKTIKSNDEVLTLIETSDLIHSHIHSHHSFIHSFTLVKKLSSHYVKGFSCKLLTDHCFKQSSHSGDCYQTSGNSKTNHAEVCFAKDISLLWKLISALRYPTLDIRHWTATELSPYSTVYVFQ